MNPIPSGEGTPQNHTPKTVSEGTWPISLSLSLSVYVYVYIYINICSISGHTTIHPQNPMV